jgi:predicted GNAT family acetyltransferase
MFIIETKAGEYLTCYDKFDNSRYSFGKTKNRKEATFFNARRTAVTALQVYLTLILGATASVVPYTPFDVVRLSTIEDSMPVRLELVDLLNKHLSYGLMNLEYIADILAHGEVYFVTENFIHIGVLTIMRKENNTIVKHVVVSPEYRDRGIASLLLGTALSDIPTTADVIAEGWTTPLGWDAQGVFTRFGFKFESEDTDYWRSDCKSDDFCHFFTSDCNCSCKIFKREGVSL